MRHRKFGSRTQYLNWDSQKSNLGLGLKIETQIILVLDSVSILWLETETQKITVSDSVSKLRLVSVSKVQTFSRWSLPFGQLQPSCTFSIFIQFNQQYMCYQFLSAGKVVHNGLLQPNRTRMWYDLFWGGWYWPKILKSTINFRKIYSQTES